MVVGASYERGQRGRERRLRRPLALLARPTTPSEQIQVFYLGRGAGLHACARHSVFHLGISPITTRKKPSTPREVRTCMLLYGSRRYSMARVDTCVLQMQGYLADKKNGIGADLHASARRSASLLGLQGASPTIPTPPFLRDVLQAPPRPSQLMLGVGFRVTGLGFRIEGLDFENSNPA